MARSHHAGTRLFRAFVLVFALLLLWGGNARAEFKTLKLPKAREFQIDLNAIVQDIPPFPTVEKEEDHYVFTGLEAWGIDKKYMSTFYVYNPRSVTGPTIISEKDKLEDRMVVYCEDVLWEEQHFPVKMGKQEGRIYLLPSDPQKTMYLQFDDKKDKKYTWRFFSNGDVTLINAKDNSEADYEDGILKEVSFYEKVGKVIGDYRILNGGMVNGEYCYALKSLMVSSSTVELDNHNEWSRITGWKNPEDPNIKSFVTTEMPFKLTSGAGTPFRFIPPVMTAGEEPVAEDFSAFSAAPDERKLHLTLADFGFPAFPDYEVDEDSGDCHITGLARWGAPVDELTVHLGTSPAYSFVPDNPGVQEIVLWYSENYPVLSMGIFMKEGSYSLDHYNGIYAVSVNSTGAMPVEYNYWGGYLYAYAFRTDNLYHFHYEPGFAMNNITMAEGLLPEWRCYLITNAQNYSEQWRLDHGEWIGESGPCPFDKSQVPPPLAYEAE